LIITVITWHDFDYDYITVNFCDYDYDCDYMTIAGAPPRHCIVA